MSYQEPTFTIEFSADVPQDDLYALEEKLGEIEGVQTDLRQPRDLIALAILAVVVVVPQAIKVVSGAVGGANAIQKAAKVIYDWRHPAKHNWKLTLTRPDGTRVDLSGLSPEEIEKFIVAVN